MVSPGGAFFYHFPCDFENIVRNIGNLKECLLLDLLIFLLRNNFISIIF